MSKCHVRWWAMPRETSKRMRTLASKLWGESDDELRSNSPQTGSCQMLWRCQSCGFKMQALHTEAKSHDDKMVALEKQVATLRSTVVQLREKLTTVTLQLFEVQKFVVPLGGQPGPRTSPATPLSWVEDNKHLLELPRMSDVLAQLESCQLGSEIVFNVCKQNDTSASRILKHCEWVVHNLSRQHPAVYKIGITENVLGRWMGKHYSYKLDPHTRWDGMVVLFVGPDSLSCGLVESYLISRFSGRSGCRNVQPGGESAKPGPGPFFTYCVWRSLAPPWQ